jgi:hypothetical protein
VCTYDEPTAPLTVMAGFFMRGRMASMPLIVSTIGPDAVQLLSLLIGGGCLGIVLGIAIMLTAKTKNNAQATLGLGLLTLGLFPLLIVGLGWLGVWLTRR